MIPLFDGLKFVEIVLLAFGSLLFVVVLVAFVIATTRGKPVIQLLPFFAVSLVMIGYSSIQKVKISEDGVEFEKYVAEVQADPANQAAREGLATVMDRIKDRRWSDPHFLTVLARGHLILGDKPAAQATLQQALKANPTLPEAMALEKRIQAEERLPGLTQQLEQTPADADTRARLQEAVSDITTTGVANPDTLASIAKAQAALGEREQAITNATRALEINPQLLEATHLRNRLQGGPG